MSEDCHELSVVYHSRLIMLHTHAYISSCSSWLFVLVVPDFTIYLLVFIFLQGKNKPWLPWVYSWIRHHRETGTSWLGTDVWTRVIQLGQYQEMQAITKNTADVEHIWVTNLSDLKRIIFWYIYGPWFSCLRILEPLIVSRCVKRPF